MADLVPVKVNLWPIGSSVPKISALPFKSWDSHQCPLSSFLPWGRGGDTFTSTVVPNATSNRHSRNLAISYVFSTGGSTGVESCAVKFENGWPIGSSESWRPGTDISFKYGDLLGLDPVFIYFLSYPFCLFKVGGGIVVS